jgi:hypothetical protein
MGYNRDTAGRRVIPWCREYEITRYGDVWSNVGKKWLKPFTKVKGSGYVFCVVLDDRWERVTIAISRTVLSVWGRMSPFVGAECHHIDHNPSNNYIKNLKWVTKSENVRASYRDGKRGLSGVCAVSHEWTDDRRLRMKRAHNSNVFVYCGDMFITSFNSIKEFCGYYEFGLSTWHKYYTKGCAGRLKGYRLELVDRVTGEVYESGRNKLL